MHAKFYSRSHDALIRVYDEAGNVIETPPHAQVITWNLQTMGQPAQRLHVPDPMASKETSPRKRPHHLDRLELLRCQPSPPPGRSQRYATCAARTHWQNRRQ